MISSKDKDILKYSIQVLWSEEDDCFVATIEEFPGLSAFGESQSEAIEEAIEVARGFIEVLKEDGDPIPEPIKVSEYSGQTRLRLGKSLHEELVKQAKREGLSLNTHMVSLLSERSAYKKVEEKIDKMDCSLNLVSDELKNNDTFSASTHEAVLKYDFFDLKDPEKNTSFITVENEKNCR